MAHTTSKMVAGKGGKKHKVYLAKWKQDGKGRERKFKTQKEARAHSGKMQKKHEDKDASESQNTALTTKKFKEVADAFIAWCKKPDGGEDPREPITIRGYESLLRTHITPHMDWEGKLYIHRLADRDLERLRDGMYVAGASYDRVKKVLALVTRIFNFAKDQKWYKGDIPALKLVKPRSVTDAELERTDEVYSKDQLYTLIAAARSLATDANKSIAPRWALFEPMVHFLIETGARIGEARAFGRENIQKKVGKIQIRKSAREDCTLKPPKSIGGRRDIPVRGELFDMLDAASRLHNHELLFPSSKGTPRSLGNLYRGLYYPLIKRANALAKRGDDPRFTSVPAWGFHAIRHAYASRLIDSKANLKQLSVWMGHSDPAFTLRVYGKLFQDGHEDVISRMEI